MLKKSTKYLNTIIGAFTGVYIGHILIVLWNLKTRPELYAIQSAPWYTSILVYGIFTVAVVIVASIIKLIIRRMLKQRQGDT